MQYSPKLKRVMEQIKKIMQDNDIGGFVALHTPGYGEYYHNLSPSYSCASLSPRGDSVIIKGKLMHYNGDAKKRDKKLTDTINMLSILSTMVMEQGLNIANVSKQADDTWQAEHGDNNHTTHNQQNN